MHVLLIIVGLLFLFFGGGCTLLIAGFALSDPKAIVNDPSVAGVFIGMGLVPLGIGWLLFRWGVRIGRDKREAEAADVASSQDNQP